MSVRFGIRARGINPIPRWLSVLNFHPASCLAAVGLCRDLCVRVLLPAVPNPISAFIDLLPPPALRASIQPAERVQAACKQHETTFSTRVLGSSLFSAETPISLQMPLRMKIGIAGVIASHSPTAG